MSKATTYAQAQGREGKPRPSRRGDYETRLESLGGNMSTQLLSWLTIGNDLFGPAIEATCEAGGSIQFGRTRKGDALTLRVFYNGEGTTFYSSSPQAAGEALAIIAGEDLLPAQNFDLP